MRTLVLSDIHNRFIRAQSIIDTVPHDKVVLLGDYFDNHGDGVPEATNTAIWLRDKVLTNPKIVALFGNHDTSYLWPDNHYFRCSGYTDAKSVAINDILKAEHKAKFGVYHIDQGYVFSHAGLINPLWKSYAAKFTKSPKETKMEFFDRVLSEHVAVDIKNVENGWNAELFSAGWDRRGMQRYGGITWADWSSFSPVSGINQIVGHSKHKIPSILVQKVGGSISCKNVLEHYEHIELVNKVNEFVSTPIKNKLLSVNYCLDTSTEHYMVIEDGVVEIFDVHTGVNLKDVKDIYIPDSQMSTLT